MNARSFVSPIEVDYHRNGISGEPFWTCRFTYKEDGQAEPYIAILQVSEGEDTGMDARHAWGYCSVLAVRDLCDGSPLRAFRGDNFEPYLRDAIRRAQALWFDHSNDRHMPIIVPAMAESELEEAAL